MTLDKLKEYVHESFENIRNALDIREKLLLRQIEVLFNHHHHHHNNNNNNNNNFNAKQQQKQYSGNSLSSTSSSSSSSIFNNNNISATSSITTSSTSASGAIKNQQQQFPTTTTTTTTTKSISIDQIKFIPDNEENVLSNIRIFGKFNLDNFNFSNDNNSFTIIEDYICPNIDHEFMYKCLKNEIRTNNPNNNNNNNNYNYKYYNINSIKTNNNNSNSKGNTLIIGKSGKKRTSKRNHQAKNECNEIIIEFTNNKTLIRENPNIINDSKMNTITLNESSDVIEKSTLFNNNSNLNNDINLRKIDNNISKSDNENNNNQNIINNCIGTINLNNNNSIPSTKHSAKPTEYNININNNNCEFYNRLMTEIKNNFIKNNMSPAIFTSSPNNSNNIKNNENNNNSNNKILFKNMDNLKLKIPTTKLMKNDVEIISANIEQQQIEKQTEQKSTTTLSSYQIMHPIQIEQWLKQIVLETEIEPMQNIEILEHSNIN